MRRLLPLGVLLAAAVLLAACAAGPDPLVGAAGPGVAGFWPGLWHGVISPITLIVSLFDPDVGIYEVRNSGGWYDAGFMIGISMVFSGPLSARRAVRRRGRAA
ncbi:hypothetical protein [Pseudonocardia sp. GCM10023141]|uniref:hypothetical protein n=1 Tax=Pseudonocardia sp. GCM10023141 TaxID=3252653 RepID=UPI00361C52B6